MIQWIRNWKDKRESRRIGQYALWAGEGMRDMRRGKTPQDTPYTYGSRAASWWLCGWTIEWLGQKEEANATSNRTTDNDS